LSISMCRAKNEAALAVSVLSFISDAMGKMRSTKLSIIVNRTLLNQGFLVVKLTSSRICSACRNHYLALFSCKLYHHVCNKSNTNGTTCDTETVYPSSAIEFTPVMSVFFIWNDTTIAS
jgi:ABC-type siderophore export system fused ATPase/permease subunit